MAESSTVAQPYAKAAFEFARDNKALQAWSQSLSLVAQAAGDSDVRERILGNPRLTFEDKTRLLLEVCGDEPLDESLGNFLYLVGEKGRLAALPDIHAEFEALRAQQEKRVDVTIVSAFALDDAQQSVLAEALKKRQAFRIAHDINRFVIYVLGRKKLFRFKTAGSPRLPEDPHHLFHEFLLRGYRIRGRQNRVQL